MTAGTANVSDAFHAVLWRRGEVTDLGTLPGGTSSAAHSINNRGQVVGESLVNGTVLAFLWDKGRMVELAGLVPIGFSFGRDINNRGQIVGESVSNPNVVGGDSHARAMERRRSD